MISLRRLRHFAFAVSFALAPGLALAAPVEVLFDLASPQGAPFPSDVFTRRDLRNLTLQRVDLPLPDCAVRVSDCEDLAVVNELDGFNPQTRLRIPLSGPIDLSTVNRDSVFLVKLGDPSTFGLDIGGIVGINQIVFDPATNALLAETDAQLEQHTTYALIVTNDVRDAQGARVRSLAFQRFLFFGSRDRSLDVYRAKVLLALVAGRVLPFRAAAVSVFTTQSSTAVLEKIHASIGSKRPAAARFDLAGNGSRTVFPRAGVTSLAFNRQVGTTTIQTSNVSLAALDVIPGAVGTLAYGSFRSPDYETADKYIPQVGTRTGTPQVQSVSEIYFNAFLPSGPAPAGGWPVVLFGHGFGGNKNNGANGVVASFASQGIATVILNVVGHGGGDQGTLTVQPNAGAPVTFPAGGRGIDQNRDGLIDITEGVNAAAPRLIIGGRDGLRQTVVDLMQLVRVIETGGMDMDGDGRSELSRERIYYSGISFGGIYGTMLLAVEDGIRAGVPNVPGGAVIDVARLGVFRPLVMQTLAGRVPPLLNASPLPPLFGFNENLPLRNQPPVVNDVPGAIEIQELFENTEWVTQQGNPVAYARHVVQEPLGRNRPKRVIFQFAKGDQTVPNPTYTAIARAGRLSARTTYFRNDLFIQGLIAQGVPANAVNALKNPHTFLADPLNPLSGRVALAAQAQIALFFATDGGMTIDPDGPAPLFETPIASALPEDLNFIP